MSVRVEDSGSRINSRVVSTENMVGGLIWLLLALTADTHEPSSRALDGGLLGSWRLWRAY